MRRSSTTAVAWMLIACGGVSVVMAAIIGWLIVSGRDPVGTTGARVAGWVMPLATYLLMIVGGILLLRRSRIAPWLLATVFVAQLPILEVGRLSYAINAVPKVVWGVWPEFGLTVSLLTARMAVTVDDRDRPFSFGFNVIALALLVWIAKRDGRTSAPGTAA
jgi:hypothetical protein